MASSRILLHTQKTLVGAIHRLAKKSSTCRVAVAYCGESAHCFFPEAPTERPHDVRIVVDASKSTVSRGLTNPAGVERLLGLPSKVRSLQGLHAKVFIFDEREALVGSTNLSQQSVEQQHQLGLEVSNQSVLRRLIYWFDKEMWEKAHPITPADIKKLKLLWPKHSTHSIGRERVAKLPRWRREPPVSPLDPSDFELGVSRKEISKLLTEFRTNKCGYPGMQNQSCAEAARSQEKVHEGLCLDLRTLLRRRRHWRKDDLMKMFDIAQYFGKAANFGKPAFIGQNRGRVAESIGFLLEGPGDPYGRYEKLVARGSRYKLKGLGRAGISFLMHLWSPTQFAIDNQSLDKAFDLLGVKFGRATSRRAGQAFKDRTAAVKEIARVTRLGTFGRTDHFLDAISKGHIGRPRKLKG